jgi:hypothetical protein
VKSPVSPVVAVVTVPVPVLVIVTDACGITAPLGSLTVPVIVPVSKEPALCAAAVQLDGNKRIVRIAMKAKLAQPRPLNAPTVSIEIVLNRLDIRASTKIYYPIPSAPEQNFGCSVYSGKDYYWFLIGVKRN